ncbi:ribonuclease inhibitor-like isoform X2 [Dysidea avara]
MKPSWTLTELYQFFIVTILSKQVKNGVKPTHPVDDEVEKSMCEMLKGIPKQVIGTVFCLGRLAYIGFDWRFMKEEPKDIYTVGDIMQCGMEVTDCFYGLLKIANTGQLPTDNVTFSFAHFTIQDFLCALYITTLPQNEQEDLFTETFHEYCNVSVFWSGLTGLVSYRAAQFVCDELHQEDAITAVQCVYESKQTKPMLPDAPFRLDINYEILAPYECLATSTVLSHYPISQLLLNECYFGDDGARMLVQHYPNENDTAFCHLERLDFSHNYFSLAGASHLTKIMTKNGASLVVLEIGWNPIGDDGISLLIEGLKENKVLVNLSAPSCEITVKGASCISKFLKNMDHTLEILQLSYNKIGDDGISMIAEGLQGNNAITSLMIGGCGITMKGATAIAELVRNRSTLLYLSLSENKVGDDGISVIAGALVKIGIRNLEAEQCEITLTGAKALAELLSINKNITQLNLCKNLITSVGARLILQSAVGNGVCHDVAMDSQIYKDDKEAKLLKKILKMRENERYHH